MAIRDPRRVAAMAYDGMGTFELGIVSEVFGLPRPELQVRWYDFAVFALRREALRGTGGIRVQVPYGIGALRRAGTIVIPGWHVEEAPPEDLLRKGGRGRRDRRGALTNRRLGARFLAGVERLAKEPVEDRAGCASRSRHKPDGKRGRGSSDRKKSYCAQRNRPLLMRPPGQGTA